MATPNHHNLNEKQLQEVIITYNNVKTKLKSHGDIVRKSMVLCPNLYIYHA